MPKSLPDPLPARAKATLDAKVQALIVHDVLDGGRHLLEADGLSVEVVVDRSSGTLTLASFPEIEDEVGTAIGDVRAVVSVEGEPEGEYDDDGGHIRIEVPLRLDAKSVFARDSDLALTLSSEGSVDQDGLSGEGDPFEAGDPTVRLVGDGVLDGGSLDGARVWLVLEGTVAEVESLD